MNETSPPLMRRPWRGPFKALAWWALLCVATFLVICLVALASGHGGRPSDLMGFALVVSVLVATVLSFGVLVVRWLFSWQNLRRGLFALACLATLFALAYAEENWRGRHTWLKHRAEYEAKGEKFTLAALIPPPVPDQQNFALTPLLEPAMDFIQGPGGLVWHDTNGLARLERTSAELSSKDQANGHLVMGSIEKGTFADIPACGAFYRGNTNYPQAPTTATAAEEILMALGKFKPELVELREAAATRPYSRFPIQYEHEPSWAILLPHLARVKGLTLLSQVHATAELEAGQPGEALDDLKLGLRLSESIHDEPILIDHLVRIATLAMDLQTVREGLVRHAWTEPQLAEIESALTNIDLLAEWKYAMRGERALTTGGLDYLRRQHLGSNPLDELSNEKDNGSWSRLFGFMPGGWYYQNMVVISRLEQDFTLPIVDEHARRVSPPLAEQGVRAVEQLRPGPYTTFARLLLPAVQKAVAKSARMQTYVDAARVACALERYRLANGKLPDTLEALVPRLIAAIPSDVIDGKPLRYKLESDGSYDLYSIGWNQTDDGGELAWTKAGKGTGVDINRGDWVWQSPTSRD